MVVEEQVLQIVLVFGMRDGEDDIRLDMELLEVQGWAEMEKVTMEVLGLANGDMDDGE